jgi:glycerol-3-phosphate dehydrogenase (NAD(P)+)
MRAFDERVVSVLGGGSWGTALAHIVASHGYETLLWVRREEQAAEINEHHTNGQYLPDGVLDPRVEATTDLERAARASEVIIHVVPSKAFREVSYQLGDFISGDQIVISATKGLEGDGLKRMSQVLIEETCARKVGALSGPNLAKEVMAGHPSATVVASPFAEVIEKAERLLAGPTFRLYGNPDMAGVEFAGALKNIYAIAGGIAAGLGYGANTLSALITRGLAESSRLGEHFGAERLTFQGLAGVGDLVATCGSTLSRNHTVGRHLAKGEALDDIVANLGMVAEGVNTTRVVHAFAVANHIDMPIARAVHGVLFEGMTPAEGLGELMLRASRYEGHDLPIQSDTLFGQSITEAAALVARRSEKGQ